MVQRYEIHVTPITGVYSMEKYPTGKYVLYSDYAKLEARVKELEDQNRWIPVEEALPEEIGWGLSTNVLTVDTASNCCIIFYNHGSKTWDRGVKVTHWKRIVLP